MSVCLLFYETLKHFRREKFHSLIQFTIGQASHLVPGGILTGLLQES